VAALATAGDASIAAKTASAIVRPICRPIRLSLLRLLCLSVKAGVTGLTSSTSCQLYGMLTVHTASAQRGLNHGAL
jgi:hypothetical protein